MRKIIKYLIVALLMMSILATAIPIFVPAVSAVDNWTLVNDARSLKAYPSLKEYVWQKSASMAPNGPYDKIGLHRLVNAGVASKGVVLMLPGTYLSGEGWTSNPATDNFTKTENDSQAIYWANRGFDVYAIDYRTHFVPTNLNSSQLGFMANWGYDQWISDIKESVTKVKDVSGVDKIFLAGFSFGGRVTMYYAAKYWQEDLKGIILLDGGTNIKTAAPTNSYNLTTALKQENDTSNWALEAPNLPGATGVPSGWLFQKQYAAQNPGAPAEYPPGTPLPPTTNPATGKPWTNITEYSISKMNGPSANITGGFSNVAALSQAYASMDRYWPDRLNLEYNAINDWTNCPYVTYDFNEYYSAINLPIKAFTSELFGLPRGNGAVTNATNPDTGRTLLLGYGHMDVYCGTYSARDVSEPVYQWLINHSPSGWTLVTDARALKAYPALKEYIWQKNATMPPNGQYDKIGLHRLVNPDVDSKGVVFMTNCPMWGAGEQRISNPATDNWTKYENFSQAIFMANRGYDVYAIDYRTHFVPKTLNMTQMSFAENWGWDVWISDIKEAADKVKDVSGKDKFFLTGECTGGQAALNYAAEYGTEDLKGIILFDANFAPVLGYPNVGRMAETNTFNLTKALSDMRTAQNWTVDMYATLRPLAAFALQNQSGPAQTPTGAPLTPSVNPLTNKTWSNITEWFTVMYNNNFGSTAVPPGIFSNLLGGYGNVTQVMYAVANSEFVPNRLYLETSAMVDWVNCSNVAFDFNDHFNQINVPILAFNSQTFANRTGNFKWVNGTANSDVTGIMLPNYGHSDVFYGTYSARDVSQPIIDWVTNHSSPALIPSATASSPSANPGQTITLSASATGGLKPYTYQWYEGTTPLAGQTNLQLTITKTATGSYTYYCTIVDAEKTTAKTNTVTLTITLPLTTPTPTMAPTNPPTPTPTPATPTPTQTSTPPATSTPSPIPTSTPPPTAPPQTPTASPSETPSQSPTQQPETQGLSIPAQATYAIAIIIIIVAVAAIAVTLRRRSKSKKQ